VLLERERTLTQGNGFNEDQTRGGGDGGLVERDLALSVAKMDLCAGDEWGTTLEVVGVTAERLEHFSAQPARSAQPPFACLSH
jgi:hypothetical protein